MAPDRPEVIALLTDSKEHPEDDTPRLILADWLEERDDPRGSFLRAQVEAARRPEGDPERQRYEAEAAALLHRHEIAWLGPLRPRLLGWEFARGLIHARAMSAELAVGAILDTIGTETLAWVDGLRLFEAGPSLPTLARAGLLDGIRVLNLMYNRLGDAVLRTWLATGPLPLLQELDLFSNGLGPAAVHTLAGTDNLSGLRRLILGDNPLGEWALFDLARARRMPCLETLQLERVGPLRAGVRPPNGASNLPALRELDLPDNELTAEDLEVILRWYPFPPLRRLRLRNPRLGDSAALALIEAGERVGRLESLSMPGCGLSDATAEALASCPHLASVRTLVLDGNQLSMAGLLALLSSPYLTGLRELSAQDMQIHVHGNLESLLAAPGLARLDYLACFSIRYDSLASMAIRARVPTLVLE